MTRRIVATVLLALVVAPASGHAAGGTKKPFLGTTCTIGDESLVYRPQKLRFEIASSVLCDSSYAGIAVDVRLVPMLPSSTGTNVILRTLDGCLECSGITPTTSMHGSLEGFFRVESGGSVADSSGFSVTDGHANCFFVHAYEVTPLLGSC